MASWQALTPCQTQPNSVLKPKGLYVKEEPNFSAKMSRPYDSMEPKVMDDDMLKAAVGEQGPQEEAGQLAKQEGILFKDVLSLQLDFQSMYSGWSRASLTFSALFQIPKFYIKLGSVHTGARAHQAQEQGHVVSTPSSSSIICPQYSSF